MINRVLFYNSGGGIGDAIQILPLVNTLKKEFNRGLSVATYLLASSFFLSGVLNYLLAKAIITSQAGSIAFNQELGKLTALSFPIIAYATSTWGGQTLTAVFPHPKNTKKRHKSVYLNIFLLANFSIYVLYVPSFKLF